MKVAVYKVNLTTCEEIYLGGYDEKSLKSILKGYKESKEDSGIYECENSSSIYYIEEFESRGN